MSKKLDPKTMAALMNEFKSIIIPWCKENHYGIYTALEKSHEDPEKERILHTLYNTEMGSIYVYETFKKNNYFNENGIFNNLRNQTQKLNSPAVDYVVFDENGEPMFTIETTPKKEVN